jgi:ketosteroid isomerase-like protein
MSEHNRQAAINFIQAMGRGDAAALAETLAPDAKATTKGFGKLSGTRERDLVVGTVESFKDLWPGGLRPLFKSVVAEGDHVAVEFEGNATLANGKPYANQYVLMFTFKDGKITQINEYLCTVLADEVMLPLLVEQGLWDEGTK